jgi:ABC-2 type transport system ATP-binding protein
MISVDQINKTFDQVKAVEDLSFKISQGEIVGLLGPNGAGKTTTMRIMSGFLAPDKGDVFVEGASVVKDPIKVQDMLGYLPENNPMYTDMLVCDFLRFSGELRGLSKKSLAEGIDFAVKGVHLEDVFYRPIKELSKGFKQRVGIAAALLHKPKVLIMDEPTEGLDPIQRNEIRGLIKELAKEHTIIISTHVMQEVEAVCTRMIIIDKGRLVVDGSVKELSKGKGDQIIFNVTIEGDDVEKGLKSLPGAQIEIVSIEGKKVTAKVKTQKDTAIQGEISKMANDKKWVIWNISQEIRQLEDIFRELTSSETTI